MRPHLISIVIGLLLSAVVLFGQRYPDSKSSEDVLQDDHISQINDHLKATDAKVDAQDTSMRGMEVAIATMQSEINGLQSEDRAWFLLLTSLISGGGIAIWFRTKKV